jgi:hypothetical protein
VEIAPAPRRGQANLRVDADRQFRLLTGDAAFDLPELIAGRLHQQEKAQSFAHF